MASIIIPHPDGGLVTAHGVNSLGVAGKLRIDGDDRLQVIDIPAVVQVGGSDLNAVSGTNTKTMAAVPTGHVHVYWCVSAHCATSGRRLEIGIVRAAVFYPMVGVAAPGADNTVGVPGVLYLAAGDALRFVWYACVVGDDLWWTGTGRDVTVT